MTDDNNTHDRALSRRAFAGLGIAAGAAAVAGFSEVPAVAGPPTVTPTVALPIEAFGAINSALTYMQIDALAFDTIEFGQSRFFTDATRRHHCTRLRRTHQDPWRQHADRCPDRPDRLADLAACAAAGNSGSRGYFPIGACCTVAWISI